MGQKGLKHNWSGFQIMNEKTLLSNIKAKGKANTNKLNTRRPTQEAKFRDINLKNKHNAKSHNCLPKEDLEFIKQKQKSHAQQQERIHNYYNTQQKDN